MPFLSPQELTADQLAELNKKYAPSWNERDRKQLNRFAGIGDHGETLRPRDGLRPNRTFTESNRIEYLKGPR